MTRTMIPMPPSQWVRERQNRIPWGRASMSANTVAPVVVSPDMASNTALGTDVSTPVRTKGRAPRTDDASHAKATMAKPSREVMSPLRAWSL